MALPLYLAMTAAELAGAEALPERVAWMACHFSAYGTGLSNLPPALPAGSVLIVNDRMPVQGHDPQLIAEQLAQLAQVCSPEAVLLDFQRAGCPQTARIAKSVLSALPCPVGVTESYAEELSCPVFLSPPPPHVPLEAHLAPWQGRKIWLEAALDGEVITVTQSGSVIEPEPFAQIREPFHDDSQLHCRYHIEVFPSQIRFTLRRSGEHLAALLAEAERLGVTRTVGLYQQLRGSISDLQ